MHGMISRPPDAATKNIATSRVVLLLLVVMTGIAPISLYILVPALPVLATTFGRDISIAQTIAFLRDGRFGPSAVIYPRRRRRVIQYSRDICA